MKVLTPPFEDRPGRSIPQPIREGEDLPTSGSVAWIHPCHLLDCTLSTMDSGGILFCNTTHLEATASNKYI